MAQAIIRSTAKPDPRLVAGRAAPGQKPLELILARNLIDCIALAAILVDADDHIVYFNPPAEQLIGRPFEQTGTMLREYWNARHGPVDERGDSIPIDRLPLAQAVREGRPAFAELQVRGDAGLVKVEAAALPLVGAGGYHGAMVVFWIVG